MDANLPFVVYSKPNDNTLSAFYQQNNILYTTKNYVEKGFVFSPFDNHEHALLIPVNAATTHECILSLEHEKTSEIEPQKLRLSKCDNIFL